MRIRTSFLCAAAAVLIVAAVPVDAHHSFAAQYDRAKPITLTGVVTKLEWINPHGRIFIDVTDASGKVVNWEIELGAPAILMRNGWKRTDVPVAGTVTVVGYLAKDGSNLANASSVTLAGGKRVFAGSSAGDGQATQ
jgi:hypothetical protein